MRGMRCAVVLFVVLVSCAIVPAWQGASEYSFDYKIASSHEIKPHRRTIPMTGMQDGSSQLHISVVVSPVGAVVDARAESYDGSMEFWPRIEPEVRKWRFTPFEVEGRPVRARVEEYVDIVPPERFPTVHSTPPKIRENSKIRIALERTVCYGTCPGYTVVMDNEGIEFTGHHYVVAEGRHKASIDVDKLRALAKRFVSADFYSMNTCYRASVTDNPTYLLSVDIDGHKKNVQDYVGSWVGMPEVIADLEDEVDATAETSRWVSGTEGLAAALIGEGFGFHSPAAQLVLKEAADRGQTETVQEMLKAGVSLDPMPMPKTQKSPLEFMQQEGWLTASGYHPEVLHLFMSAGASRTDQKDKDLALAAAARSGKLDAVRSLIAYGANPNADMSRYDGLSQKLRAQYPMNGSGSVLIDAATSGNAEVVGEILRYHPDLEARGFRQETAIFALGESHSDDQPGARVACLQMLVQAGANVNARNFDGDTPLHRNYLDDLEAELLRLGADVNARNNNGETPLFTNVDDDAIDLFISHGADLTLRDKKGRTVFEAAKDRGPAREEALRKAVQQVRSKSKQ